MASQMSTPQHSPQNPKEQKKVTALLLVGVWIAMLGISFAAVPLYRLFCQKTGYGGTPKIGTRAQLQEGERILTIRFNSDIDPNLPCDFYPLQAQISLKTGVQGLAYYRIKNRTDHPVRAMATYNVTPEKAASYFNKVQCFCFEAQTLPPGEELDMPVLFFVDHALEKDSYMNDIKTLTLSYTFFRLPDQEPR